MAADADRPRRDEAPAQPGAPPAAGGPAGLLVPGTPDPAAVDDDAGDDALAPEELDALIQAEPQAGPAIRPGSRCKGVVVAVVDDGVMVAFGAKVEGRVPLEDFRLPGGQIEVRPGQEVEVVVERLGSPGAYAALSHRRVREAAAWKRIEAAHEQRLPVQARIVGRVKGGLRVDIGVAAFLPGSQLDVRHVRDLDAWVGRTVDVVVIDCDRRRSNAVVSRSELLRAERQQRLDDALANLAVGEPAAGVVKNVTSYGVFVDLGGIDGLIKLADLSYSRVRNPSDIFKPGQEVTAKVVRIEPERERVALSLRAMQPDPWHGVADRYAPGARVSGRVTHVADYGTFVELEPGVEGLIHISETDWSRHPKHPSKTFTPGAETEAVVLKVSPEQRQISLSFKRLAADPWEQYSGTFEIGQVVSGVVRQIVDYGLFVEIVKGVEGLVHVSDLSWNSRAPNPRAAARKGQRINTVILRVDQENRRLALGIKQLEPDGWDAFLGQAAVGDVLPGVVRRKVDFGVFVELAPGVEGLCHSSQAPRRVVLQPGRRYEFELLDINERSRRIRLRCERPDALETGGNGSEESG